MLGLLYGNNVKSMIFIFLYLRKVAIHNINYNLDFKNSLKITNGHVVGSTFAKLTESDEVQVRVLDEPQ
jgi:hypothetical protein